MRRMSYADQIEDRKAWSIVTTCPCKEGLHRLNKHYSLCEKVFEFAISSWLFCPPSLVSFTAISWFHPQQINFLPLLLFYHMILLHRKLTFAFHKFLNSLVCLGNRVEKSFLLYVSNQVYVYRITGITQFGICFPSRVVQSLWIFVVNLISFADK